MQKDVAIDLLKSKKVQLDFSDSLPLGTLIPVTFSIGCLMVW